MKISTPEKDRMENLPKSIIRETLIRGKDEIFVMYLPTIKTSNFHKNLVLQTVLSHILI